MLEGLERVGYMDMHGCSANEAIVGLETAVSLLRTPPPAPMLPYLSPPAPPPPELRTGEAGGGLRVVTGKGLHSGEGGAVIKPAVESMLEREGLEWSEVVGNPGALDCWW
jgi:hypothetical protein